MSVWQADRLNLHYSFDGGTLGMRAFDVNFLFLRPHETVYCTACLSLKRGEDFNRIGTLKHFPYNIYHCRTCNDPLFPFDGKKIKDTVLYAVLFTVTIFSKSYL